MLPVYTYNTNNAYSEYLMSFSKTMEQKYTNFLKNMLLIEIDFTNNFIVNTIRLIYLTPISLQRHSSIVFAK